MDGRTGHEVTTSALKPCLSPPPPCRPLPPCRRAAAPTVPLSRRPMPCLPSVAPRRLTADPYRAAPPLHTHTSDFLLDRVIALKSEPSRRCVPQRPRWARRTGPRVLRSNLAELERRLARWMLA